MQGPRLSETHTLLIRPRGALVLCTLMYLAAALHPILLAPLGWPSMEVLWFALLIPTIILSFYYGRRGAFAAILIGVTLFLAVELLAHSFTAFTGDRALFATSVFLALTSLAVGIGELAELLRREYVGRVRAERAAATNDLAVALKHEIHNPLAALLTEIELLDEDAESLDHEHRDAIRSMVQLARRIRSLVDRAVQIEEPKRIEYLRGTWMTDLSAPD